MYRRNTDRRFARIMWFMMLVCAGVFFSLSCEETTGPQSGGTPSNYHVLLTAGESTITTNGGTTVLIARVYTGSDTANGVSGIGVEFTASLGDTLFPVVVENNVTDANGVARARVFGTTRTGTVAVTAMVQVSVKEQISAIDFVTIAASTGPIGEVPSDASFVQADYSETFVVATDGTYSISVTALVSDVNRNQVKDGTVVKFSIIGEGGLILGQVGTQSGVAATNLIYSQADAGKEIILMANSGSAGDTLTVLLPGEEVGTIVNDVSRIELIADVSEMRADENKSTRISAILKRSDGTIINAPTTVLFETDLGVITQRAVSDSATGTAVALFTSDKVGTAHIKASVGNVFDTIDIFMIPGPPLSVTLGFEPASVGIQGSGRNASLLISAQIFDERNNPVRDSTLVRFELIGSVDPDASLSSPIPGNKHITQPIPTTNGTASVSFTAGNIPGAVRVRATVVDVAGAPVTPPVSSETTDILVYSGPPFLDMSDPDDPFTESRITLSGGPLNIFASELNTGNSKSSIGIMISDEYQNPVPEGTAIWLTTTGGMITTSTAYTEMAPSAISAVTPAESYVAVYEGITYVTLYAGNPLPTLANSTRLKNPNFATHGGPVEFDIASILMTRGYGDFDSNGIYNNGISIISGYTMGLDDEGNQVVVWNFIPIVFSHEIHTYIAVPDRTVLELGDTANLTITVMDRNGNPVVGGSILKFDTDFGSLSTDQIITADPGKTQYTVSLTNDLDPMTDTATNTVVNVTIESPNGNVTFPSDIIRLNLPAPPDTTTAKPVLLKLP